jgi:AcrR family transcriptional regulator
MNSEDKPEKRTYRAPHREAAAERTREAIVASAKHLFEERGWAGATMREIGIGAGVSQKTIEAIYQTKDRLLQATVEYSIRGDVQPVEMQRRAAAAAIENAPDAESMLELHAAHIRRVTGRSAGIARVVEQAARGDDRVAALWEKMNHNRSVGVKRATSTLLAKPNTEHLVPRDVEAAFWITVDWGTYRVLTEQAGLSDDEFQAWLVTYYRNMFLRPRGAVRRQAITD